jgi:hypothetical protein
MVKYFMERTKTATSYDEKWLETDRPQPLVDSVIEKLIQDVVSGKIDNDISDQVYTNFKYETTAWLFNSKLNTITGLDSYSRVDIINGCTQFIDDVYMQGPVQVLRGDYRYHERLGLAYVKDVGSLIPDIPLIVAMPFPSIGAPHQDMEEILHECKIKNIAVHIDGAWISCCRNITFDFNHVAIRSVGISLSKGLGLGWNRIGLRWTRQTKADSVTIMNDFRMNNRALAMIGLHFIRNLPPDYLWNTHGRSYYKVCYDFNLMPTNSIYLALRNGQPVGVSPLLRYLENASS